MSDVRAGTAGSTTPPTPEQDRLIAFGEALYRRLSPDAALGHVLLPEDDAVAVVHRVRGGGTILVAADRSVLFSGSAQDLGVALAAFRAGGRTPVERWGQGTGVGPGPREAPGPTPSAHPAASAPPCAAAACTGGQGTSARRGTISFSS
ncbi:hypothetical protein E6R60_25705 [Streptomyces sp. A0642]|uniref:hypothetical protein n=1 Tax=Streptomyces sp. A0642 TaxID=2563100 RepID=UPI0010A22760|nr:hypothetical protein [Streptomyces sp. A0642]THA73054.1 hypothetical protein E6R60_25705 [Streptomyces sp. A0642]